MLTLVNTLTSSNHYRHILEIYRSIWPQNIPKPRQNIQFITRKPKTYCNFNACLKWANETRSILASSRILTFVSTPALPNHYRLNHSIYTCTQVPNAKKCCHVVTVSLAAIFKFNKFVIPHHHSHSLFGPLWLRNQYAAFSQTLLRV